jgi:hypothetical protein
MIKSLNQGNESFDQVIGVDLGHSKKRDSCGIFFQGQINPEKVKFGELSDKVIAALGNKKNTLLIIEAPLSKYYDVDGNPSIRGGFEINHPWYYGTGATMLLAAQEFLKRIIEQNDSNIELVLQEAFLTRENEIQDHGEVAKTIVQQCKKAITEKQINGLQPILMEIKIIPGIWNYTKCI